MYACRIACMQTNMCTDPHTHAVMQACTLVWHCTMVLSFTFLFSLFVSVTDFHSLINCHSRRFGLVPLAAEDYGDMSMKFKVVAVARKTDKQTTLFNMKGLFHANNLISWPFLYAFACQPAFLSLCLLVACLPVCLTLFLDFAVFLFVYGYFTNNLFSSGVHGSHVCYAILCRWIKVCHFCLYDFVVTCDHWHGLILCFD